MKKNNQDPTAHSQWRRQDDTPSSGGVVNLQVQGAPRNWCEVMTVKSKRIRLEFHNMQISDHRNLQQVLKNLREKLNLAEEAPIIDLKRANVLILGL